MRKEDATREWREFEIERWRSALRERGLHLNSLDPVHQEVLFERIRPELSWRCRFLFTRPALARKLRTAGRLLLMASLLAIGYGASFIIGRWAHPAIIATMRESCIIGFAEMPPSNQIPASPNDCVVEQTRSNR